MSGRVTAWLNLAYRFGVHVLRMPARPFTRGRDVERFRAVVEPEGFVPLTRAERALMPASMRCVSCGLCSLATADRSDSAWSEAWTFVAGSSRSLDDALLVASALPAAARAARADAVCPTGVPITRMAAMFERIAGPVLLLLLSAGGVMAQSDSAARPRAREIGIVVGILPTGPLNAITDVAGVRVGQVTVTEGDSIRTGVTAIVQHAGNVFRERVPAALHVGNGFGKITGVTQLRELGEMETPILLTCTLCVWRAADAMVDWLLRQPGMDNVRSINPIVGETNDGTLNDIRQRPIRPEHVSRALESASGGAVTEGAVGAGAGTVAFGWKGGIGTSSRSLPGDLGGYTVGVLVQSNFGGILTINGAPVGRELGRYAFQREAAPKGDGSIMIVVATDAPLDARNLDRLGARALTGLARTGSSMSNGSGDYVLAFSTAPQVRRGEGATPRSIADLPNDAMSLLFQAVAEATEEAVYNSMLKATTTRGHRATIEALPVDRVVEILKKYNVLGLDRVR